MNQDEIDDDGVETICCKQCDWEYDRHIGDICPNCGEDQEENEEEEIIKPKKSKKKKKE